MNHKDCILYQKAKEGKRMPPDGNSKKLSDIDIAVILESIKHGMETIKGSVARVEAAVDKLPCDSLTERIVRLETQAKTTRQHTDELERHKEVLYKKCECNSNAITGLKKENDGQTKISDKLWGLMGVFLGAACTALVFYVTRG